MERMKGDRSGLHPIGASGLLGRDVDVVCRLRQCGETTKAASKGSVFAFAPTFAL
jgi:hypothetical protein